jgi:hypothetical protein
VVRHPHRDVRSGRHRLPGKGGFIEVISEADLFGGARSLMHHTSSDDQAFDPVRAAARRLHALGEPRATRLCPPSHSPSQLGRPPLPTRTSSPQVCVA